MAVVRGLLPPGGRAWLIGSLAWGGFGAHSDVDLVLADVDGSRATAIEVAVCKAVGVEVDLLMLQHLPQSFRERVEREGDGGFHGGLDGSCCPADAPEDRPDRGPSGHGCPRVVPQRSLGYAGRAVQAGMGSVTV